MPTENIQNNRKTFIKEILQSGEKIINGTLDGEVSLVNQYRIYYSNENAKPPRTRHMTLIPTNKRIVVYQRGTFLGTDKFSELPIAEIDEIAFIHAIDKRGRDICITEFIAPNDSKYKSISFKFDTTGYKNDYEQYMIILRGISQLSGIPIDDYSNKEYTIKNQ